MYNRDVSDKGNKDDLLTLRDITEQYGIGRNAIQRLVREGDIRCIRIGRRKQLVPRWVLHEWFRDSLRGRPPKHSSD